MRNEAVRTLAALAALAMGMSCRAAAAEPAPSRVAPATLYGQQIVAPDASRAVQPVLDDAARVLRKMTGRQWKIVTGKEAADVNARRDAGGIFVTLPDSPLAPADAKGKLRGKGREPFLIRAAAAPPRLWIVANGDAGLRHGLYYYLGLLGARWLAPGDGWEVIPKREGVGVEVDAVVAPAFRQRNFFGTGGLAPGHLANDKRGRLPALWDQWKARNRFGGEYAIGGHSGEAFNLAMKDVLVKHPEYLAKVDGKHVPWSVIAKLNTANPDAVKRYVNWTVGRFRQMRKADPLAFAVSVEPADGGGHCNSEECRKIGNGSPSDQVFHVANLAARAVRAEFPDGWVSLLAYNEHAAPPSFALEPNVFVSIVPYGFNRSGLQPEEFIRAWGKKVRRLGLYDYWSIPDWNRDLPGFDFRNTPREKVRFWRANRIEGFLSESTYSTGAMGPAWYVAARLMWDDRADDRAILDEWFSLSFGPAKAPMRRMLERWADGFTLLDNELVLSYRDLSEARQRAVDDAVVLRRVADFGRYIEYLRLTHRYQTAANKEKEETLSELVRYLWGIYPTGMVHSFRLYQLLSRGNKALHEEYGAGPGGVPNKADAPGWKQVTIPDDEEIFRRIGEQARSLKPLDYRTRSFRGALAPVPPDALPRAAGKATASMVFIGNVTLEVEVPKGADKLNFRLGSGPPTQVQLRDADGNLLHDGRTAGNHPEKWDGLKDVSVPLPRAGHYRLSLLQGRNTTLRVEFPRGVRVTLLPFTTPKPHPSPSLWFYVPKGVKNVAIHEAIGLPEILQPYLIDPSGTKVAARVHENRRVLLYRVPEGMDGKLWKVARIVSPNGPLRILNAPNVFSAEPNQLMIPADAVASGEKE